MKHLSNHTERMISMAYNWHKMVTITVPVGLNGWLYSGQITINGIVTKFPVGVETSLPEPVAAMIQQMIAVEEDNKVQTPDNLHTGSVTIPAGKVLKLEAGALVKDEAGVLGTGGGGTSTVVVLEETTLTGETSNFVITTPFAESLVAGNVYKVTYNGTEYECTGMEINMDVTMVCLGNLSPLGVTGGNDDAPFVIGEYPPEIASETGASGMIEDFSGANAVIVSIIGTGKTETAGGGVKVFTVTATAELVNGMQITYVSHTLGLIREAVRAGHIVRMLFATSDTIPTLTTGGMILPLTFFDDTMVVFCAKVMHNMTYEVTVTADGASGSVGT